MDPLADKPFYFIAFKDGRVMIYAHNRLAKTLKGNEAARFTLKAESLVERDLQMLMAKITGQFKFGNER
ncbi:MAG: hypothetical protein NWQ45_11080 [Congregibacter sp.]|nr:hypothetical protein [Congregibacter sp.]